MILLQSGQISGRDAIVAALNDALRLEHATIPPYLTAWLTLSGAGNGVQFAKECIRQIMVDEMRHMQLVGNMLVAIGEKPVMQGPDFIPRYPGPLPRGIGDDDAPGGLMVRIVRYSKATVRDIFMQIEEPEKPIALPTLSNVMMETATYKTIGQFYADIGDAIKAEGDGLFVGDHGLQVTHGADAVTNVGEALAAIDIICQQGEGTPATPIDQRGELAHYYQFEAMVRGMKVVPSGGGFAFDPTQPIAINDDSDVIPMTDDPRLVPLVAGSQAALLSAECDLAYSNVLREIHAAFNGEPDRILAATGLMYVFTATAGQLLQERLTDPPYEGKAPGPRFMWLDG